MDVHDKATRSFNMSRIRSRDTQPEILLRKELWRLGCRGYRTTSKLPGKPDVVFAGKSVVVFVDGCFWHGCPSCGDGRPPRSNLSYWKPKLASNRERDIRQTRALKQAGWTVIRFWEHEVTHNATRCARRVLRKLM